MKHIFILKGDTEITAKASVRISRKYGIVKRTNEPWRSTISEDPFDVAGNEIVLISNFVSDKEHYKEMYENQGRKVIMEYELNAALDINTLRRIVEDGAIRYLKGYIYGFDQDKTSYHRMYQKIKKLGIDINVIFPSERIMNASYRSEITLASEADFVFLPEGIWQYPVWKNPITEHELDEWLEVLEKSKKHPLKGQRWHFILSHFEYKNKAVFRILNTLNEAGHCLDEDVFSYSNDIFIPDDVTKVVISKNSKSRYEYYKNEKNMLDNLKPNQEVLLEWDLEQKKSKEEENNAQNDNCSDDKLYSECLYRFLCLYAIDCLSGVKYQHLGCRLSAECETLKFNTQPNH